MKSGYRNLGEKDIDYIKDNIGLKNMRDIAFELGQDYKTIAEICKKIKEAANNNTQPDIKIRYSDNEMG